MCCGVSPELSVLWWKAAASLSAWVGNKFPGCILWIAENNFYNFVVSWEFYLQWERFSSACPWPEMIVSFVSSAVIHPLEKGERKTQTPVSCCVGRGCAGVLPKEGDMLRVLVPLEGQCVPPKACVCLHGSHGGRKTCRSIRVFLVFLGLVPLCKGRLCCFCTEYLLAPLNCIGKSAEDFLLIPGWTVLWDYCSASTTSKMFYFKTNLLIINFRKQIWCWLWLLLSFTMCPSNSQCLLLSVLFAHQSVVQSHLQH